MGEINFDSVLLLLLDEDRCEPLKTDCGDRYNDIYIENAPCPLGLLICLVIV